MNNKKLVVPMLAVALMGGAAAGAVGIASAATNTAPQMQKHMGDMGRPAVFGTVSSVSGTTIVVAGKDGTNYTIDAANAKVMKAAEGAAPASVTVSAIATGDTVMVRGTVSGTSVVATDIMDGMPPHGMMGGRGMGGIMGTVSAISGSTLTVTTKDGGTITVNAGSATVRTKGTTSSLSSLKIGDTVHVGGTITTATMTAENIDSGMPTPPVKPAQTN